MNIFYLANVGTQDVTWQGKPLSQPRQEGEALLRRYEVIRNQLDVPILVPGLSRAVEKVGRISQLVLFVSDQPATTLSRYRDKDTVYLGELLKLFLSERFGPQLGGVIVEPLLGNPADYNVALDFFAKRLPDLLPSDRVEVVYVVPVGGADASNVGLWVSAIRLYRRKVELLYVMPDGRVDVLALHAELLRETFRAQVAAHLGVHDYAGLERLLRAEPDLSSSWVPPLCNYAHHRLHFDFTRAMAALTQAQHTASGERRAQVGRLQASLTPFLQRIPSPTSMSSESDWKEWLALQRQFLGELFVHLQVKAEQQEWLEFVGRLFRLHEALLRFVFEEQTRHGTEGSDRRGYPDYARALTADSALESYLRNKGIKEMRATTYTLGLALEFWVTQSDQGRELGPVLSGVRQVEKLSELRNRSAIAHGYEGVSREQIEQIVSVPVVLDAVRVAMTKLGIPVNGSPFANVQHLLHETLGV